MFRKLFFFVLLTLMLFHAACNGNDDDDSADDSDDDLNDDDDDDDSLDDDDDDFNIPDGWRMELVNDNNAGNSNQIDLSINSEPYIAYYRYGDFNTPYYAYYNGENWVNEQINSYNTGGALNFFLDSSNVIQESFIQNDAKKNGSYNLIYLNNKNDKWQTNIIDNEIKYLSNLVSMALNSNNQPSFFYENYSTEQQTDSLFLADWNGTGWDVEWFAVGSYPVIAIDADDKMHLAYTIPCELDDLSNPECGQLYYATNQSGEWVSTVIDKLSECQGPANYATEFVNLRLEIDSQNKIHLAYQVNYCNDLEDGGLGWDRQTKYGYMPSNNWSINEVKDSVELLDFTLDLNNQPHLLIADFSTNDYYIWLYSGTDSSWETLNLGLRESQSDLIIDENGYKHISYMYREDENEIRHLYYLTDRPE